MEGTNAAGWAESSLYLGELEKFGLDWAEVEWLEQSEEPPTLVGAWLVRKHLLPEDAPTVPGTRWTQQAQRPRPRAPVLLFVPQPLALWVAVAALTVSLWSGVMLAATVGMVLLTFLP
jgi:hypothetical protein